MNIAKMRAIVLNVEVVLIKTYLILWDINSDKHVHLIAAGIRSKLRKTIKKRERFGSDSLFNGTSIFVDVPCFVFK